MSNFKVEIYTLEWCPYCRKAKAFFKSKGIDYEEYQIEDSENKREMLKRTDGEKTVPQIFIKDRHIGGYDALIEFNSSGKLKELMNIEEEDYTENLWDLIIVGAGPAGLSSAIYAARKGLEVLVLALAMGGQVIETDSIENWPGEVEIGGLELMQNLWDHTQNYGVKSRLGEKVVDIENREEKLKIVKTELNKYQSKSVIIASGTHKRKLGVKGENEFKGKGVHYCAICDGFLYAGEPVVIVGGGNAGLEAAIDMAKLDSEVYLIEFMDHLMGDKVLQNKVKNNDLIKTFTSNEVQEIKGNSEVESVVIRDNETGEFRELEVDAVFIEIGLVANSGFVNNLLETNDRDEIIINGNNETSKKGIWAAGDVTNIKDKQIVVASGEGASAALRVNEFLNI